MNEKHVNIRQASNGYIVSFYENSGGNVAGPSYDVTYVFTTVELALEYAKNILTGAKSAPIAELPADAK